MARQNKKQIEQNAAAFAAAEKELGKQGASINPAATSFTITTGRGSNVYGVQINACIALNADESTYVFGIDGKDGNAAKAKAFLIDVAQEAMPQLTITSATIQNGVQLFPAAAFTPAESDNDGMKDNVMHRAAKHVITQDESAAKWLHDGIAARGGVDALAKAYRRASKKGASEETIADYMAKCYFNGVRPVITTTTFNANVWAVKTAAVIDPENFDATRAALLDIVANADDLPQHKPAL